MNYCPFCKNQFDLWQHVPILGVCGSCFFDGPYKRQENAVWVPTKLRSEVEVAIENLRVASDLSEASLREQCADLSNGLNSIYHSMSQLKDRVKSSKNVGGLKKIPETCQKELVVLEAVKTHMSTQFTEQSARIEEGNQRESGAASYSHRGIKRLLLLR